MLLICQKKYLIQLFLLFIFCVLYLIPIGQLSYKSHFMLTVKFRRDISCMIPDFCYLSQTAFNVLLTTFSICQDVSVGADNRLGFCSDSLCYCLHCCLLGCEIECVISSFQTRVHWGDVVLASARNGTNVFVCDRDTIDCDSRELGKSLVEHFK